MPLELEVAEKLSILAAGVFFLVALLTGTWKWRQMRTRADHQAHPYVDIVHRASLMYAFSALLLAVFAWISPWSPVVDLAGAAVPLFYFASAIAIYAWHAWTEDTDNQFAHTNLVTTWGTAGLVVGEIGGFLVLFAGVVKVLLVD